MKKAAALLLAGAILTGCGGGDGICGDYLDAVRRGAPAAAALKAVADEHGAWARANCLDRAEKKYPFTE